MIGTKVDRDSELGECIYRNEVFKRQKAKERKEREERKIMILRGRIG